jgi:hypothetical protein
VSAGKYPDFAQEPQSTASQWILKVIYGWQSGDKNTQNETA